MSLMNWTQAELARLRDQNLLRDRREVHPLPAGKCVVSGRTFVNFASNDYLGLAGDPRLADAAVAAMKESGTGARASPLVTGRTSWHVQLEQALAEFKQSESAILFPTGFAANLGTVAALVGPEDVVFCDRLNHASLIDGCRLSRATFRVYPHRDVAALERELRKAGHYRRRLIVTDSLFSMDGDHAPLHELNELASTWDAMLLVDEAHATGVFGTRGTGLLEQQNVHSDRIIPVGTLSKGLGGQGGFVTGPQTLIDWLWNSARTQIFSTALSIPACAAATTAISLVRSEPERRVRLLQISERVRLELSEQGWTIPAESQGPVIPIVIGAAETTMQLAKQLEEQGILAGAIRPPTVPKGTSRLRISLSAAHSDEDVSALITTLNELRRRFPL